MREAIAPDRLGHLLDDPGGDRLLEDAEEPFLLHVRDPLERLEAELPSHDRGGGQHLDPRLAEPPEPPADHVAHALRQAHVLDPRPTRPLHPVAAEEALVDEVADDLLDEEGVPLGLAADRAGERLRHLLAAECHEHRLDVVLGQTPQENALDGAFLPERRQHRGQRMPGRHFDVAVRGDHQQARRGQLAGEEAEQEQRRRVGPVEVVEDEDERPRPSGAREERREGIKQPKARLLGVERRRHGEIGKPIANLRNDLGDVRRGGAEDGLEPHTVALLDVGADDLRPGPVRRCALALPRASPEDLGSPCPRVGGQSIGELALPDPGLAGHEAHAATACHRALEPGAQRGELRLAADEDPAGRLAGRRVLAVSGHGRGPGVPDRPSSTSASRGLGRSPPPGADHRHVDECEGGAVVCALKLFVVHPRYHAGALQQQLQAHLLEPCPHVTAPAAPGRPLGADLGEPEPLEKSGQ